jgi:hypothetical protein
MSDVKNLEYKVDYVEYAKEDKLSNVFRVDYINDHLKLEFGQVKGISEEEIKITVISSIIIPKQFIEIFVSSVLTQTQELAASKEIDLKVLQINAAKDSRESE